METAVARNITVNFKYPFSTRLEHTCQPEKRENQSQFAGMDREGMKHPWGNSTGAPGRYTRQAMGGAAACSHKMRCVRVPMLKWEIFTVESTPFCTPEKHKLYSYLIWSFCSSKMLINPRKSPKINTRKSFDMFDNPCDTCMMYQASM